MVLDNFFNHATFCYSFLLLFIHQNRSIIAGLLHGVGCNVVSAFGTNISRYDVYYKMYREEENKIK